MCDLGAPELGRGWKLPPLLAELPELRDDPVVEGDESRTAHARPASAPDRSEIRMGRVRDGNRRSQARYRVRRAAEQAAASSRHAELSHQLAVARTEHAVLTTNVEVVEKLLRVRDDCISLLEQARGDADTRLELGPRCPRLHGLTLGQLGLLDVIYSHRHALSEVVRMASGMRQSMAQATVEDMARVWTEHLDGLRVAYRDVADSDSERLEGVLTQRHLVITFLVALVQHRPDIVARVLNCMHGIPAHDPSNETRWQACALQADLTPRQANLLQSRSAELRRQEQEILEDRRRILNSLVYSGVGVHSQRQHCLLSMQMQQLTQELDASMERQRGIYRERAWLLMGTCTLLQRGRLITTASPYFIDSSLILDTLPNLQQITPVTA